MEICLQVQTSLTQLQISSFHVVGRTRTAAKCSQLQFFNAINIVFFGRHVSWFLKLNILPHRCIREPCHQFYVRRGKVFSNLVGHR